MPPVPVGGWRSGWRDSLQPCRQQRSGCAGPAWGLPLAIWLAWLWPCAAARGGRALCSGRDGAHQWSGLARGPSSVWQDGRALAPNPLGCRPNGGTGCPRACH
eukprot:9835012-Alexandrium_andersonii.AAC.1